MKTTLLVPSRIGCPSLPGTMKGIVMSVPGVDSVEAYYEQRALRVTYDEGKISPDELIKKIGLELGLAMRVDSGDIAAI
jgi:copper chaperone CopZ